MYVFVATEDDSMLLLLQSVQELANAIQALLKDAAAASVKTKGVENKHLLRKRVSMRRKGSDSMSIAKRKRELKGSSTFMNK